MLASSLGRHLADVHDIYQLQVISKELLEDRPPATYTVTRRRAGKELPCPFPLCEGVLKDGLNLCRHFWDVHPMDMVVVPLEGKYRCCHQCGMQINPSYPWHYTLKEYSIGVERKQQWEAAVTSALALRQQFLVHGDVLEQVEVFKYLGRLLAQDDHDIQAICAQLWKARATWARVGQVLRSKNASPRVSAKFYKAVVQAVLLYGSETWVLSSTALARLEGFHICAAYRIAKENKPCRGPGHRWVYPKSADVLEECGLKTIAELSMSVGKRLRSMWRPALSLTNVCRASESEGQYRAAGGGNRR